MYIAGITIHFSKNADGNFLLLSSFLPCRGIDIKIHQLPCQCSFQIASRHAVKYKLFIALHEHITIPKKSLIKVGLFER